MRAACRLLAEGELEQNLERAHPEAKRWLMCCDTKRVSAPVVYDRPRAGAVQSDVAVPED